MDNELKKENTDIYEKMIIDKNLNALTLKVFGRFISVYLGIEMGISVFVMALMRKNILPSTYFASVVIVAIALALYLLLSYHFTMNIYLDKIVSRVRSRKNGSKMYLTSALSAYGIVILITVFLCNFFKEGAIWFFAPMRLLRALGTTNLISFSVTHIVMLSIIIGIHIFVSKITQE